MIIVDSNVWIFAEVKGTPEHYAAIRKLQRYLREGVGINVVILSEVFHKLSRLFDMSVARRRVRTIIHHPAIEWLNVDKELADRAVELGGRKLLRINDAIIAQQAIEAKVPVLTDNVKDFRKVEKIEIVSLR